jgi:protein-S-isoprenylcysteine O-methyltransferase Ste14
LLQIMIEWLRLSALALYAAGPVVAAMALLGRWRKPSPKRTRIRSWRWYVPSVLLPVEWLLPPILIALRIGETDADWLPVRVIGLGVGVAGAGVLIWSAVVLGRFLMHEAALREDHTLIATGPYQFVRHPVYAGYLALLLGSGVASMNVSLWLLWPISLAGILLQAASEERLLTERFGQDYEQYLRRTGRLVPRVLRHSAHSDAVLLTRAGSDRAVTDRRKPRQRTARWPEPVGGDARQIRKLLPYLSRHVRTLSQQASGRGAGSEASHVHQSNRGRIVDNAA